jgi:hypothetical protein
VLLNVPDGITPGTLTYTYGTIAPGANTGNVWHYTAHVADGYYDVTSASVDVDGVTVSLHNPSDYAGTYNCSQTQETASITVTGTCNLEKDSNTGTATFTVTNTGGAGTGDLSWTLYKDGSSFATGTVNLAAGASTDLGPYTSDGSALVLKVQDPNNPSATVDSNSVTCEKPEDPQKINICHYDEGKHEYSLINVAISAVINGHGDHGNDIWAAFSDGETDYPAQGDQSLLENGCQAPAPAPKPVVIGFCYYFLSDVFKVTVGNAADGGAGYIGYSLDGEITVTSLGQLNPGENAPEFSIPGSTLVIHLWTSPDGSTWTAAGEQELNTKNQCEIDPIILTNVCDPATGNIIWTLQNDNPIAITFTWKWDGGTASENILVEANSSATFTTASQPGTVIVSTSTGVVVAQDAAAPCTFTNLSLKAFCSTDPATYNAWTITNPNTYPVSYEVNKPDLSSPILGSAPIPGNSSVNVETLLSYGNIILLYSGGNLQDSATAASECIPPENPPDNPPTPLIPVTDVTPPRATGGQAVLIPVTGVDMGAVARQLPGAFTNTGLGFLGLGLVLSGLARRREE